MIRADRVLSTPPLIASRTPPLASEHLVDREGEPRLHDIVVAERLGFDRSRKVRDLIERNLSELRSYGEVRPVVGQTSQAGGRPAKEYWLNEGQALVICALSRTPQAAAVRKQIITVFMAYRAGKLGAPTLAAPGAEQIAGFVQTAAALRADVDALRTALAAMEGRIEQRDPAKKVLAAPAPARGAMPMDASGANLLLGVAPIAAYLGITPRQAKHRARAGGLPTFKLGRAVCSSRTALDAWLSRRLPAREARS